MEFGIPVDVDAECANVVGGLSIGFLCVCLVAGAVLGCISFVPDEVVVNVGFAIAGFGGLQSGLTLNQCFLCPGLSIQCFLLIVLAVSCEVAPQSLLLFHLVVVLWFVFSLPDCQI